MRSALKWPESVAGRPSRRVGQDEHLAWGCRIVRAVLLEIAGRLVLARRHAAHESLHKTADTDGPDEHECGVPNNVSEMERFVPQRMRVLHVRAREVIRHVGVICCVPLHIRTCSDVMA